MRITRRVRRKAVGGRRSRRGGKEEKGGWVGGVFGGGRRSRRGGVEESADDPDGSNWVTMGADTGGKMAKGERRSRRGLGGYTFNDFGNDVKGYFDALGHP